MDKGINILFFPQFDDMHCFWIMTKIVIHFFFIFKAILTIIFTC